MNLKEHTKGMYSVRIIRMFENLVDVQQTYYGDSQAARNWYAFSTVNDMDTNVEREFIIAKLIELLSPDGGVLATSNPQMSRE
jgi:hypothetical protein